jgi:hypothetical protein
MRIADVDADGRVTVLGAGEHVSLTVWNGTALQTVAVDVPPRGWTRV